MNLSTYTIPVVMLVMGLLTHWLKQIIMARRAVGSAPSLHAYWLQHWPETLAALTSGVAGFAYLVESQNLSALNAFGVGYIANSIADMLGTRVQALIAGALPAAPPQDGAP